MSDLEDRVASEACYVQGEDLAGEPGGALVTHCLLTLEDGFTIVGRSSATPAATFDEAASHTEARNDALAHAADHVALPVPAAD